MRKLLAALRRRLVVHFPARTVDEKKYKTVYIREMGIELSIPTRMIAITWETDRNDPCFKQIGETAESVCTSMRENLIYLRAVDPKRRYEIRVRVRRDNTSNFIQDEKTFRTMSDWMVGYAARHGLERYKNSEYVYGGIRYLYESFQWKRGGAVTYRKKYSTVHNGRAIAVNLVSVPPYGLAGKKRVLKRIVESVRISDLEPVPEPILNPDEYYCGVDDVIYDLNPPEKCCDGWDPVTYDMSSRYERCDK